MPSIVTVNVTQTIAPTPNKLQQTGALISQGATNTAQGVKTFLTQYSDLASILTGAQANSTLTWSANVATVNTAAPHGFPNGSTPSLTIAGVTPMTYNGTFQVTITGTSSFTYALTSNPGGSASVPGVFTPEDVAELVAMVTTFFGQGAAQGVYVLELGPGDASDGVTYLTTYLSQNQYTIYAFLVPRYWADESTYYNGFLAPYQNTTAKVYFFTTMTLDNYTNFTDLQKDVVGLVEAPGIPVTEFSLAAQFYNWIYTQPSTTNKVAPFSFRYVFGVTPYPTKGGVNNQTLTALKAANVNYIGTGAEGGISLTAFYWGTMMDGRPMEYWYSVDWVQINLDLDTANAVINGSNNPINPLYYNQDGINRLSAVAAKTMNRGVTFGMVLGAVVQVGLDGPDLDRQFNNGNFNGQTVVNAVPFIIYSQENPSDYKIGKYAGLAVIYTPLRGFISIIYNVNVTDFVAI